jgi:hypothetical protein
MKLANPAKALVLPSLALVTLFIASGSVATLTPAPKAAVIPSVAAAAEPELGDFCSEHWGELVESGRYCRFDQVFHLNLKHAGKSAVVTSIPVLRGDQVRIQARAVPETVIGTAAFRAGEDRISAPSAGYLTFRAPRDRAAFSVERVALERCFAVVDGRIDAVACPVKL